jgi:hypothetical protein
MISMPKETFRTQNFRGDSYDKISKMISIVDEYQSQGLRLTARQLYYQFVARDFILNTPAAYKKLTSLLSDARYAGLVDWDAIEDRGRVPERHAQWSSLGSLVDSALHSYRLPRWKTQPKYVELWVEKQALAGVLSPIADQFHVTLMVNKGYSSSSAMYEAANRIKDATISDREAYDRLIPDILARDLPAGSPELKAAYKEGGAKLASLSKPTYILYLGDHDPSGEDMVRDVDARLSEFGCLRLEVIKIALTMDQVKKYDPPPNPAKVTDPRAKAYREKFGDKSWEVDALPPDVLATILRSVFSKLIDKEAMEAIKAQEELDKVRLREVVVGLAKE